MSKQIDERVVSMQFDNKQFEANVQTSMSTLDKLKAKLHLNGASKGLESVNAAAKKVDMSGLSNGIETVRTKFSAMEVMGVTALANITNSAVNAGKKIVSALTIDPVRSGFQEYETQMNAVQTILANTKSKGSTLDDVNKALDTLNTYADKTIYNFTEMTRNIGTFTAAGVDLQTSVDSIQGIANLAAVSGSSSQQASTAMYQLSQALAAGRVSLMDWNSVVNAGMGGELFQNALIRTSELLKTGAKDSIATYGSFRESLTKGQWLTTEVLTETLKQLSGAYSEADLIAQGFTKEQAKEITSLAQTATDAATKVKTFSQLWDVMKESAQSGWAQTWKLIVGDFEQAKALLTPLADFFTGMITKMSNARNKLLEGALGKSFTKLGEKIKGALKPMESTAKAIGKVADTVKDYGKVVDEIIGGKWGNGQARWDKLTKAGYDWAHAQNLVNEKLGDSTRHTTKYKEAQDGVTKSQDKSAESSGKLTKAQAKTLEQLIALSDAELKAKGYTDEQIEAFRELERTADKLGLSISDLILNIDDINGRWLLINSFKNIGQSIVKIFKAIGDAWREIFPPMTSDGLFNIIAGFHKFSTYLKMSDDTADKLKRTLKGVFAILDVILTVVGGPIKIAFKILTSILGAFDLHILDITAAIGDAIVKFRNWIKSTLDFSKVAEFLVPYLKKAGKAIREWFASLKDSKAIKVMSSYLKSMVKGIKDWFKALKEKGVFTTFISYVKQAASAVGNWFAKLKDTKLVKMLTEYLKSSASSIKEWFSALKESDNIPRDLIIGFVNGIKSGIKMAISAIGELASSILETFREILGIHSPSTETYSDGKNLIMGFVNGIKDFVKMLFDLVMSVGKKVIEIIKDLDIGALVSVGIGAGLLAGFIKIGKALEALTSPLEGVGDILQGAGKVLNSFSGTLKSLSLSIKANAIKSIAVAIAILVGSIFVLCMLPVGKVWASIGAILALAVILGGLTAAIGKFGAVGDLKLGKITLALMGLSFSIILLAAAMVIFSAINIEKALTGLGAAVGSIIAILITISKINQTDVAEAGYTIKHIGNALLKMALVMVICGLLSPDMLKKGIACIVTFSAIIAGLIYMTKFAGKDIDNIGNTISKISSALIKMALVMVICGLLSEDMIKKGLACILTLSAIVVGLMYMTKFAGKDIDNIGKTISKISSALIKMALVVVICGLLSPTALAQGIACVVTLAAIVAGLIYMTKFAGKDIDNIGRTISKIGGAILMLSISVAILAGVAALLSMIDPDKLKQGLIAVGILTAFMIGLVAATYFAKECKGTIIALSVAVGILAIAVIALSFINPLKLIAPTIAMGLLMYMFALILKSSKNVTGSMGTIIAMAAAIAVLGAILILLSKSPWENTIASAVALGSLMFVMTMIMKQLAKMDKQIGSAMAGAVALSVLCIPLFVIGKVLSSMKDTTNAINSAIALSILLAVMAGVALVLSKISATGLGNVIAGAIGLLVLCVPLLALVGIVALMSLIDKAAENLNALTKMLLVMASVMVVLALVGPLAMVGVGAVAALTAVILAIGVLALAIGGLLELCPSLEKFISTGLALMIKLAKGIGEMIGAFIGGIIEQVAASLPALGTCLSLFMMNATPFLVGIKMVDSSVLEGVKTLAAAVILLAAADFISNIMSFLSGGSSFADLGTQLSAFMINATPFLMSASLLNADMMNGIKSLAQAILILTAADILNGIKSFFTGGSSLADFGNEIAGLGTGLRAFKDNLGEFDETDSKIAQNAANAVKALAEASSKIPNEGGWAAKIFGDNSLEGFSGQIATVGQSLRQFVDNIGAFGEAEANTVKYAAQAITEFAKANDKIPNEGGWAGAICGENNMEEFGTKIAAVGTSLRLFIDNIKSFTEEDLNTVKFATQAITEFAKANHEIPNEGGWAGAICGENSLGDFGEDIANIGLSLSQFVTNLGTFGEEEQKKVAMACLAILALADVANQTQSTLWDKLLGNDDSLTAFGKKLPDFGSKIAEFAEAAGDVEQEKVDAAVGAATAVCKLSNLSIGEAGDKFETFGGKLKTFASKFKEAINKFGEIKAESLTSAIEKSKEVISFAATLKTSDLDELKSFGEALKTFANNGIKGFVNTLTGIKSKASMTTAIVNLITHFNKGIAAQNDSVNTAISNLISGALSKIKTPENYDKFKAAGAYCGDGFVQGVNSKKDASAGAGTALGKAALDAAKKALDENSPSKEMYKVGNFAGIGFVNALYANVKKAYQAGTQMANSTKNGISKAISNLSELVNTDIDAQPTIRPVLDLSDVKSGANSINGMFSNRTLAINTGSIGTISASMAELQNGNSTREIVSGIKALRKDISNMPRNTYSVNGITYDDGSNISEAVKTLVRAAKIERRV